MIHSVYTLEYVLYHCGSTWTGIFWVYFSGDLGYHPVVTHFLSCLRKGNNFMARNCGFSPWKISYLKKHGVCGSSNPPINVFCHVAPPALKRFNPESANFSLKVSWMSCDINFRWRDRFFLTHTPKGILVTAFFSGVSSLDGYMWDICGVSCVCWLGFSFLKPLSKELARIKKLFYTQVSTVVHKSEF